MGESNFRMPKLFSKLSSGMLMGCNSIIRCVFLFLSFSPPPLGPWSFTLREALDSYMVDRYNAWATCSHECRNFAKISAAIEVSANLKFQQARAQPFGGTSACTFRHSAGIRRPLHTPCGPGPRELVFEGLTWGCFAWAHLLCTQGGWSCPHAN